MKELKSRVYNQNNLNNSLGLALGSDFKKQEKELKNTRATGSPEWRGWGQLGWWW